MRILPFKPNRRRCRKTHSIFLPFPQRNHHLQPAPFCDRNKAQCSVSRKTQTEDVISPLHDKFWCHARRLFLVAVLLIGHRTTLDVWFPVEHSCREGGSHDVQKCTLDDLRASSSCCQGMRQLCLRVELVLPGSGHKPMDKLEQLTRLHHVRSTLVTLVRSGSATSDPTLVHDPNSVAHQPSKCWQPRRRTTPSRSSMLLRKARHWHSSRSFPCVHHSNHLRVAEWDFLDDRGPTTVRMASPRDFVSECRDRRLSIAPQQDPLIPELFKKTHDGCCRVCDRALRCRAHERLDVISVPDGYH